MSKGANRLQNAKKARKVPLPTNMNRVVRTPNTILLVISLPWYKLRFRLKLMSNSKVTTKKKTPYARKCWVSIQMNDLVKLMLRMAGNGFHPSHDAFQS